MERSARHYGVAKPVRLGVERDVIVYRDGGALADRHLQGIGEGCHRERIREGDHAAAHRRRAECTARVGIDRGGRRNVGEVDGSARRRHADQPVAGRGHPAVAGCARPDVVAVVSDNEVKHIPYMLVVGEKEAEMGEVNVRKQGAENLGNMKIDDFGKKIAEEVNSMINKW